MKKKVEKRKEKFSNVAIIKEAKKSMSMSPTFEDKFTWKKINAFDSWRDGWSWEWDRIQVPLLSSHKFSIKAQLVLLLSTSLDIHKQSKNRKMCAIGLKLEREEPALINESICFKLFLIRHSRVLRLGSHQWKMGRLEVNYRYDTKNHASSSRVESRHRKAWNMNI